METLLERLTGERKDIESRLADPATYAAATGDEQRRVSARHGELLREISTAEERWLEVASTLEQESSPDKDRGWEREDLYTRGRPR